MPTTAMSNTQCPRCPQPPQQLQYQQPPQGPENFTMSTKTTVPTTTAKPKELHNAQNHAMQRFVNSQVVRFLPVGDHNNVYYSLHLCLNLLLYVLESSKFKRLLILQFVRFFPYYFQKKLQGKNVLHQNIFYRIPFTIDITISTLVSINLFKHVSLEQIDLLSQRLRQ